MKKAFKDFPNAEYIISGKGRLPTRWRFYIGHREYAFNEEDLEVVERRSGRERSERREGPTLLYQTCRRERNL